MFLIQGCLVLYFILKEIDCRRNLNILYVEITGGRMTLKKVRCLFVCMMCVWGMMNCREAKYADAKKVTIKYLDAMEKYASAMENANSPEAFVRAVDDFVEEIDRLTPEMEEIEQKYPELTDMTTPPAEMEDLAQRMNVLSQRLVAAQNKLMQYASDPNVQRALRKLQNVK